MANKIKVKMLSGIAGLANPEYDLPEHGYAPEEIVEVHPDLAEAWIASGLAEAVRTKAGKPVPVTEPVAEPKPEPEIAETIAETAEPKPDSAPVERVAPASSSSSSAPKSRRELRDARDLETKNETKNSESK